MSSADSEPPRSRPPIDFSKDTEFRRRLPPITNSPLVISPELLAASDAILAAAETAKEDSAEAAEPAHDVPPPSDEGIRDAPAASRVPPAELPVAAPVGCSSPSCAQHAAALVAKIAALRRDDAALRDENAALRATIASLRAEHAEVRERVAEPEKKILDNN